MLKRYQIICRQKNVKIPCRTFFFPDANHSKGSLVRGKYGVTLIETPGWTIANAINQADKIHLFDENNLCIQKVRCIGVQKWYTVWMNILQIFGLPKYTWGCCGDRLSIRAHNRKVLIAQRTVKTCVK